MNPVIRAENISRSFGQQRAVDQLHLSLARGEALALLGTNGAGKTTTLKLLVGELSPHTGTVYINDIDLNTQAKSAKRHIGFLPDTPPLYEDLTVDEYLYYCARLHLIHKKELSNNVTQVKKYCELTNVSNKLIRKLSKGYQQRIGIAQAIVHKPAAIILDEPTNGLDPTQIQEMRDLINDLKTQAGVLLSTHQLTEVEQVCDRVQMIKAGCTVFSADTSALQDQAQVRLRFSSLPPKAQIQELPNLNEIIDIQTDRVTVTAHGDIDSFKTNVIACAQQQHWSLVEIYDVSTSIEDVFIKYALDNQ